MNFSTFGANAVLDGTAVPATLYVKLHIGNPGSAGTANAAAETARKAFTRIAAAAGLTTNAAIVEWLNAAADEDITHVSAWSTVGPAGGNCWFVGPATNGPVVVLAGNTIQIDIGELVMEAGIWT